MLKSPYLSLSCGDWMNFHFLFGTEDNKKPVLKVWNPPPLLKTHFGVSDPDSFLHIYKYTYYKYTYIWSSNPKDKSLASTLWI